MNNENEIIGVVTSGTMSPSLTIGFGLGYVNIENSAVDTEIFIQIRKNRKKAVIVNTPFK